MTEVRRVAVVTGAAGGIGAACARAFLAEGACVVAAGLEAGEAPWGEDGERCRFVRCDISDETSVAELFATTARLFGRMDVLVNNAAVLTPTKAVHETTAAELDHAISVNLRGTFLCCSYALPHLRATRGCIVNVSSMSGLLGEKNHAIYAATKGAINALTLSMAADYGSEGIRCNAVCPGAVRTAGAEKVIAGSPDAARLKEMRDAISVLGTTATPEQVAAVVAFLASPAAGFMTGALVPVSGGAECGYGIRF